MNVHFSRLIPVSAAVALLLAACGADDPTADSVDLPTSTVASGELRAPMPIRATGGGSAGAADEGAALASDAMIAPAYYVTEFVVGDGLAALPGNTTGYVFDAGAMPSAEDAARLAAALGVGGEPVLVDDGYSVSYRVGPDDGSAPSVVVWDDALLSWNYNGAWGDEPIYGCAVAGSVAVAEPVEVEPVIDDETEGDVAPTETIVVDPDLDRPIEECVEPEPPTGVPTAAEAERLAVEMLTALGVDTASLSFDTWADEWSAGVGVSELIDGVAARRWDFGFGGEAELQWAGGSVAAPEPVGPYPLVDLDTAVARLNDDGYGWGGRWGGGPGIAVMTDDVAIGSDIAVSSEPAIAEPPPGDLSVPEAPPEPEMVTVTLVDVQPDLWWVWDVDGSAWLVPAYRFIGDDEGWYTVPAVTDEFLVQVEPTIEPGVPEPMPVEPPVEPGDGTTDPPPDAAAIEFGELVGSTLDEFIGGVERLGYTVRVVERDGAGLDATDDFDPFRINVAVVTVDGVEQVVRASTDDGTVLGEVTIEPTEPSEPTESPETAEMASIVGIYEGVQYYPACGNETLQHEGTTWYQVQEYDYPDEYAAIFAVDREQPPATAKASGFARVVAPGPGDDVGTLVVWSDGVARFVSDSGDLTAWLIDDELTYNWEC